MSLNKRIIRLWLAFACLGIVTLAPIVAQSLSASNIDSITDVFIGKDTKGPYVLNWNNVETDSEMVIVSGRKLTRGQDYTIDYASGAIAFSEPLPQDAIIRVTYKGLPEKSKSTGGGLGAPLSARLLESDKISLDATGFYRGAGAATAREGTSVFGLSSSMKLRQDSDISSTFLITNGPLSQNGETPGLLDRAALKLGAATNIGGLSFKGSLARVGDQFGGSKEYGLQHAKELLDLSAAMGKPTDVVYASFSYKEQEDIGGAQKGAMQSTSEQKVVLNLLDESKVTVSRAANERETANGAASGTTTDVIQLDQGLGQKTTATASMQMAETNTGGSTSETKTSRVALQSSAIDKVQFQGGVTWKDSGQAGTETGVDLGMRVTPTGKMSVDANYSNVDSDVSGQRTTTGLRIAANPLDRTELVADFSTLETDTGGQIAAGVKVATRPVEQMKVEASYAGKQIVDGADEQQRALKVEGVAANYVKISAGLGEKEIGEQQQFSKEAAVEVAPNDRLRLATGYKMSGDGENENTTRDYSGMLKPVQNVEVSGSYRNRDYAGNDELNSRALRLALGQAGVFRLTGQYAYNPEDNNGNVQRFSSTALGIEMRVGILGITGAYTEKDEYVANSLSQEKQVGLSVPIFGYGKLSTGFRLAQAFALSEQDTYTYSIGYTHIIGSSFSLSLTGELTRLEAESLVPQDEYKATAKLGMKF